MAEADLAPGIFVGVDSGGTRTNVRVEIRAEPESPIEMNYEVSESLSGALPDDMIPTVVRRILAPLEARLSEAVPDRADTYVWISAAGFTQWTGPHYATAMDAEARAVLGGRIRAIGAANDAVSMLLGSDADGVIIAGTGSNVLVRTPDGDLHQAGGHEWVACDYGSGFWIGLRGIREAYHDFEGGEDTALLQRLCELYSVRTEDPTGLVEQMRRLAVGRKDFKKEIARFAPSVCEAARRGDSAAQNLVKQEAERLADETALALRRWFERSTLESGISLLEVGSLLGNDFYRSSFQAQLEMRLLSDAGRKARITWAQVVTGEQAAVRLARAIAADASSFEQLAPSFRPALVVMDRAVDPC